MEKYEEEKQEYGDDFYAGLSTASILPGRIKDSDEAKSRLVNCVKVRGFVLGFLIIFNGAFL
jgi:hypothetical protein